MKLISHRGAAGLETENSIKSFATALKYRPSFIETDAHLTIDGVWVIFHGRLKEVNRGIRIPNTYLQLKTEFPHLITVQEFILTAPKANYILDVKCKDLQADLFGILQQDNRSLVKAFTTPHLDVMIGLKKEFPKAITMISQVYQEGPFKAIELARDYGFDGISLSKWWLSPVPYLLCKKYRKLMMVYTIDQSWWIWLCRKFFNDIYLVTNYPDRFKA